MPVVSLSPIFNGYQAFSSSGLPLAFGTVDTFIAGSSTPLATYTTAAGNIANSNPITLLSDGRPPQEIWLLQSSAYRFVLKDALGNQIGTYDDIRGVSTDTTLRADLADPTNASNGDALVGVKSLLGAAIGRTQHSKNAETLSVLDYGADPIGATDSTAAFQAAIDAAAAVQWAWVIVPTGKYLIAGLLNMKPGVHLVGMMPAAYFASSHGTGADIIGVTLNITGGAGFPASQPTITMQYNTGLHNMALYWPNQIDNVTGLVANIVQYPWAIQVGQAGVSSPGNADNCVIKNVTLLNPYLGITDGDNTNFAGQTVIENVNIFPLTRGLRLTKTLNTITSKVNVTPTWWQQNAAVLTFLLTNATSIGIETNVKDYAAFDGIYVNLLNQGWVDTSTGNGWVEVTNCAIDECQIPLTCNGSTRFTLNGGTITRGTAAGPLVNVTGAIGHVKLNGTTFIGANAGKSCGVFSDHTGGILTISNGSFENADKPAVISVGTGQCNVSNCGGTNGVVDWHNAIVFSGSVNGIQALVKGADVSGEFTNLSFAAFAAGLPTGWSGLPSNAYCTQITGGIKIGGGTGSFAMFQSSTLWPKYGHFILEFTLTLNMASAGSYFYPAYAYNSSTGFTPYLSMAGGDAGYAISLPQGVAKTIHLPIVGGVTSDTLRFFFAIANVADFFSITNVKIFAARPPGGQAGTEYSIGVGTDTACLQYANGRKTAYVSAIPTVGTYAVGDRAVRIPPVVGQPKAWSNTAAGSPGTMTSEGDL